MRTLLLLALAALAAADVYVHNPRCSNNRLNEGNDNTQNANRLYNSQNNNAGGYGIGPSMYYYAGSWLTIEWTNQHSCGENPNSHCEIILQYMCGKTTSPLETRMRDGTSTTTIPNTDQFNALDGTQFLYGMHEAKEWYNMCETRSRNLGLFIADRTLNGNTARFTRQNNNGDRYGFECPEERDYYPYWHPTPWKDIAILVSDTSRCDYYLAESQNTKAKSWCENPDAAKKTDAWQYNNQVDCEKNGHTWAMGGQWDIKAPECLLAPWSRDNHLGNAITDTLGGYMAHYNWTLPTAEEEDCIADDTCQCVFRLRYNISTGDFPAHGNLPSFTDSSRNTKSMADAVVLQDPYVKYSSETFSLALNTNQYGRTFQDRSHIFSIKPRPSYLDVAQRIFNVNVRGKRGNIVQTYPAVEYDFVPNQLLIRHLDWVHFQWTGFDNNPNNGNNNGEGTDGTDRSNVVQTDGSGRNYPMDDSPKAVEESGLVYMISNPASRRHLAFLGQTTCRNLEELRADNANNENNMEQDGKNCMKLNAAPAYFDGGVFRMNRTGTFNYMSTRNNNFSNRSQKASITVVPILGTWSIVVSVLGALLCLGSIGVGAALIHAKRNPMSRWAQVFERI